MLSFFFFIFKSPKDGGEKKKNCIELCLFCIKILERGAKLVSDLEMSRYSDHKNSCMHLILMIFAILKLFQKRACVVGVTFLSFFPSVFFCAVSHDC